MPGYKSSRRMSHCAVETQRAHLRSNEEILDKLNALVIQHFGGMLTVKNELTKDGFHF